MLGVKFVHGTFTDSVIIEEPVRHLILTATNEDAEVIISSFDGSTVSEQVMNRLLGRNPVKMGKINIEAGTRLSFNSLFLPAPIKLISLLHSQVEYSAEVWELISLLHPAPKAEVWDKLKRQEKREQEIKEKE